MMDQSFFMPVSAIRSFFQTVTRVPCYRFPKTLGWPTMDETLEPVTPPASPSFSNLHSFLAILPNFFPPSVRALLSSYKTDDTHGPSHFYLIHGTNLASPSFFDASLVDTLAGNQLCQWSTVGAAEGRSTHQKNALLLASHLIIHLPPRVGAYVFFLCGAVRARSSDGHQSICKDCPFPRMRKSETIPKVSLETKATSNKQKQHKTATNHKQQTNNPGHLAKKSETLRFQKYPLVSQYCSTTK